MATPPREPYVHPSASHAGGKEKKKKKKAPPPYYIEPITAFYLFLAASLAGALFAPIQDCDETFNYWEPTHYLTHGHGLQTWEYAPDHAIRSWLYVGLHALAASLRRVLPRPDKVAEFYFVRYALAAACALCQTLLWKAVAATLHPRIGLIFIAATIFSPGNFHASAAYLPSSFAMYATMLAAAAFMDWRGGRLRTAQGMGWSAVGAVVGWPFAAVLCAPYLLEETVLALLGGRDGFLAAAGRVGRGAAASAGVAALDIVVNSLFYRKVVFVPWNIVRYNVLSSTGGPNLYGTEPWTFYFRNLVLNFNLWFVLALLAAPLFMLQKALAVSGRGFRSGLRTLVFLAPFYIWLAIFTLQPHKEERFMYPVYPLLALNAAVSAHILLVAIGHTFTFAGGDGIRAVAALKLSLVVGPLLLSAGTGLARIYGLHQAYSAPLQLYGPLWVEEGGASGTGETVCFGKEWYRFPSSFFLPGSMRPKFVRSEFRGLLPAEFAELPEWQGIGRPATWLSAAPGLNDRNEEDPTRYVDVAHGCDFLVDTQSYDPRREGRKGEEPRSLPAAEPDYIADREGWEVVNCLPFLDAAATPALARIVWVPDLPLVPERLRRRWGRHCLLRRRRRAAEGAGQRTGDKSHLPDRASPVGSAPGARHEEQQHDDGGDHDNGGDHNNNDRLAAEDDEIKKAALPQHSHLTGRS